MRASGILLPIFSLPSHYGIGCFSESAYRFVDMLKEAGQSYWQILPLGPTGYGDSPYQSFSTFAGNPYFISLDEFINQGWLTEEEVRMTDLYEEETIISYDKLYKNRFPLLKKAFLNSNWKEDQAFVKYTEENKNWLYDYALFMTIKEDYEGAPWYEWEDALKYHEKEKIELYWKMKKDTCSFFMYLQYIFAKQWQDLKAYANENGIGIIGDLPIYVAYDSADVWSHPELFQLAENMMPIKVAGCPPDAFSEDGQLWGNPLYDWEKQAADGYTWWKKRMENCEKWYDVVRLDHFRGFASYYAIPYGEATARNGAWEKGPGITFFQEISKNLHDLKIIAEDLGYITDDVRELLQKTGYPGMKVLEFAFDASGAENPYLPHHYIPNCVVYTGTHDNMPLMGWYDELDEVSQTYLQTYMQKIGGNKKEICRGIICEGMKSVADLCIVPLQDYFLEGKEARINFPSTTGKNWRWRLSKGQISKEVVGDIAKITKVYGRLNQWRKER